MSNLQIQKLGKYIEILTDYHANGSYESLRDNVVLLNDRSYSIMIRTLNFERNDFVNDLIFIDKHAYEYLAKSKVYPNDILVNKIANPGSVYIMPDLLASVSCGMNLFLIRFKESVNQRYMYYCMKNYEDYIKSFAHGTTTKTITKDEIRNIELPIHVVITSQNRIESLLTAIDKKIDLNRKVQVNMTKIAQILYDYWFMQFDFPNYKGNPYRNSGGEMQESDKLMYEIPKGWKCIPLSKRFVFDKGIEVGADKYSQQKLSGYVSFFRVGDLNAESNNYVDASLLNGKLLIPEDICVSFDGTVGKVDYGLSGGYSSGIRRIYDKMGEISNAMVYFIFISDYMQSTINKYATGSNILHASAAIDNLYIVYNEDVYKQFSKLVDPIFEEILHKKQEIVALRKLRDWLLPMLMNGQAIVE